MLETLRRENFTPHVGDAFRLRLELDSGERLDVELVLMEVNASGDRSARQADEDGRRRPFSAVFRGPGDAVLPQRIYPLEHDAMGTLELFLVPLGPDKGGMLYEAVFT